MSRQLGPSLDALLTLLKDGDWHGVDEIAARLEVSREKILMALGFLSEYSIVEFEEERDEARITGGAKRWLMELQGVGA